MARPSVSSFVTDTGPEDYKRTILVTFKTISQDTKTKSPVVSPPTSLFAKDQSILDSRDK